MRDTINLDINERSTFVRRTCERTISKEIKTRKRIREPETWIDNKAKKARISGSSGVGRKQKLIPAKKIGDGCGSKCQFKCQVNLSIADREYAFHLFRSIEDRKGQWQCINNWASIITESNEMSDKDFENMLLENEKKKE